MMRRLGLAALVAALWCGAAFATDCSGTIISGGSAQAVANISGNVSGLLVMNNSANLMCIAWTGNAAAIAGTNCAAGSWPLAPGTSTTAGGSFNNPLNIKISTLSIISSGTGDRFSCERQ